MSNVGFVEGLTPLFYDTLNTFAVIKKNISIKKMTKDVALILIN